MVDRSVGRSAKWSTAFQRRRQLFFQHLFSYEWHRPQFFAARSPQGTQRLLRTALFVPWAGGLWSAPPLSRLSLYCPVSAFCLAIVGSARVHNEKHEALTQCERFLFDPAGHNYLKLWLAAKPYHCQNVRNNARCSARPASLADWRWAFVLELLRARRSGVATSAGKHQDR